MIYRKLNRSLFAVAVFAAASLSLPALAQTLKTGIDATFAPHAMAKLGGGLQGFNIDLGEELSKKLGKKIDIEGTEFSALIPGLNAKKYDFVIAPVTVTPERSKNMLFSDGYLNTDYGFVQKKSAPDIKTVEDLKGKTITVNKGSAYENWARDNAEKLGFKYDVFGTNADAVQAVLAGRADANMSGNTSSAWSAKQNPDLKATLVISTGLVWAMAFRLDDKALRNEMSMAIKCMKQDGSLAKIVEKWLGEKPKPGSAAATITPGFGVPGMEGYDPTPATLACK
ncbi:transporter substrate-binding domain-containing protein [Ferrovibrio terrae]|jgi:polar amino acid transport system substrate-binding protein|uniref:transporter substrate-binding domain-containing protein n=1 Tax=Ferrovibrio terrae TaxID=2594003 RepID=UPI003137D10F